jgi:hypothetical protein
MNQTPIAAFRAPGGQEILYLADQPGHGQVLHRSDGGAYHALAVLAFTGTPVAHELTVEDPRRVVEGTLCRHYAEVVLGVVTYKQVPPPTTFASVPLPRVRTPVRLIRLANGRFVYLSAEKYDRADNTYRLFIGPCGLLREIPVREVTRAVDGGAACVATAEETLFCDDDDAAWGDEDAVPLDPEDFDIHESDAGVTIAPRLAVADAEQLLRSWHKRPQGTDAVVWSTEPDDPDYAAIGVDGKAPFVQIWLPGRRSVVLRGDDARVLLAAAG